MTKINFHPKTLALLGCGPGIHKAVFRDKTCKGLSLEVRATGGRTWYLTHTNARGKRHQHRLGDFRNHITDRSPVIND